MIEDMVRFILRGNLSHQTPHWLHLPKVEVLEERLLPGVISVTSRSDAGANTFRQAILDSNAGDTIEFHIGTGFQSISLLSPLPSITKPTIIDGSTQLRADGTSSFYPLIEVNGSGVGNGDGLVIDPNGRGSKVIDLLFRGFQQGNGITLNGGNNTLLRNSIGGCQNGIFIPSNMNVLKNNQIGSRFSVEPNSQDGVLIQGFQNQIGGIKGTDGNDIAGNNKNGVHITVPAIYQFTGPNVVKGNYIGPSANGTGSSSPNLGDGVLIDEGARQNIIGGDQATEGNIISANHLNGVHISGIDSMGNYTGTKLNFVSGNYIGIDKNGADLPNGGHGVLIEGSFKNRIGGDPNLGYRNVISGNFLDGVHILGADTNFSRSNIVQGNYIGTKPNGTEALANRMSGITIENDMNTVGGQGLGNVISGNSLYGVNLSGNDNTIANNFIGLDKSGAAPLRNAKDGIRDNGRRNSIGNNKVAWNGGAGVYVASATGTTISSNFIFGNQSDGISINGSSGELIQDNYIGTDDTGVSLANAGNGILIQQSASNNSVINNILVFNAQAGITVLSGTGNRISQNSIYANGGLGIDLGGDGVTQNDSMGHSGPNLFQDFPVLTEVTIVGGNVHISGYLNTAPNRVNSPLYLEFFVSPLPDPSGYGQGKTSLGPFPIGYATGDIEPLSADFPYQSAWGDWFSATATDEFGNTSEISQAVQPPSLSGISPASGHTTGGDLVTISGNNFRGVRRVMFGDTPAASFVVNSPTRITAVSPRHAQGDVDVRVTTAGGTSEIHPRGRFTFNGGSAPSGGGDFPSDVMALEFLSTILGSSSDLISIAPSRSVNLTTLPAAEGATLLTQHPGPSSGGRVLPESGIEQKLVSPNSTLRAFDAGRKFDDLSEDFFANSFPWGPERVPNLAQEFDFYFANLLLDTTDPSALSLTARVRGH